MLIETKVIILIVLAGIALAVALLLLMKTAKNKANESVDEIKENIELNKMEPVPVLIIEKKYEISPGEQRRIDRNKRRS